MSSRQTISLPVFNRDGSVKGERFVKTYERTYKTRKRMMTRISIVFSTFNRRFWSL